MPNKECLTCKPGDKHSQGAVDFQKGCDETYLRVDACMKLNNGRVSACTKEWKEFRECYEKGKVAYKNRHAPFPMASTCLRLHDKPNVRNWHEASISTIDAGPLQCELHLHGVNQLLGNITRS